MITIVEPFIGVLISSFLKRGIGERWGNAHSLGMILEILVDYTIIIFLVFMATTFSTNSLKYEFFSSSLEAKKEIWIMVFIISILLATLCWKQSKNKVLNSVNIKNKPEWGLCLVWSIPNLLLMVVSTHFIFNVKAV